MDGPVERGRLADILDHVPVIVWEARGAPGALTQRLAFVGQHVQTMLGYSVQECLNTPNFWISILHPEDRDRFVAQAQADFVQGNGQTYQVRCIAKGGRSVWVEMRTTIFRDQAGAPVGLRGVCIDITQQKQAEAELHLSLLCTDIAERRRTDEDKETSLRLLELIDSTRDGHKLLLEAALLLKQRLGCDAVGIRLREGEDYPYRAAVGFAPEFVRLENALCATEAGRQPRRDAQGRCVCECVCGHIVSGQIDSGQPCFTPYGSFWTDDVGKLLAAPPGGPSSIRGRCVQAGYQSIALLPLRVGGECLGLLHVSDRRQRYLTRSRVAHLEQLAQNLSLALAQFRTQEALRAAEGLAALGRLAARIAHEINNPLAGIKNSFLLIKDAVRADHPYYRYVGRIESEIDRVSRIVRQLFDLYRPQDAEVQAVSISDVVRDVTALLSTSLPRGVRLEVDLPPCPVIMKVPESSLRQILFNLLQNAIDASPQDGKVTVGVMAQEPLVIWVADQGSGVPSTLSERVFEPFFSTKAGSVKGLGLGLSISRSLAASMGGSLDFVSLPGQGTTFRLTLPGR